MSSTTIGSLTVGPLCLGTNVFGRAVDNAADAARILDAFVDGGGDFVDTADLYGNTVSETFIGKWLAGRGRRDDVVVATKIGWPTNEVHKGLKPDTMRAAVDDCLRRLRSDRIDLLYTHHDDETVTIPEIVGTLDELVRAGKVREIAASNLSPERLTESLVLFG
jgi:aryl-alcohol dehydrogenase-like predicted oxidoreductase